MAPQCFVSHAQGDRISGRCSFATFVLLGLSLLAAFAASGCGRSVGDVVSAAEYDSLKNGMSYEEVCEIIGDPGVLVNSIEDPPIAEGMPPLKTTSYVWTNSDKTKLLALFQNNRLTLFYNEGL